MTLNQCMRKRPLLANLIGTLLLLLPLIFISSCIPKKKGGPIQGPTTSEEERRGEEIENRMGQDAHQHQDHRGDTPRGPEDRTAIPGGPEDEPEDTEPGEEIDPVAERPGDSKDIVKLRSFFNQYEKTRSMAQLPASEIESMLTLDLEDLELTPKDLPRAMAIMDDLRFINFKGNKIYKNNYPDFLLSLEQSGTIFIFDPPPEAKEGEQEDK